jgi:hypothetical protein
MRKLTLIIGLFMLLMACHKYENGPFISFRSVKSRVIGNWKLVAYTVDGEDQLDSLVDDQEFWWRFKEDYTLEKDMGGTKPITGEWEIDENNDIVVTLKVETSVAGDFYMEKDTLYLTRLTNKEMWAEHVGRIVEKYEAQ